MTSTSPPTPLTTVFTPPSSCKFDSLSTWFLDEFFTGAKTALTWYNVLPSMNPDCVPSGYNTETVTATPSFSPGVCPKGYTPAASFGASSTFTSWCCPRGLAWTSNTWGLAICGTSWTESGFSFSRTETRTKNGSTTDTYLLLNEGTQTGIMVAQFTPVIVTWASSDLAKFTPSAAPLIPPGGTAPQTASAISADGGDRPMSPLYSSSSSPVPSSSLSTGAKAGIGVGVAVCAISIIAALVWFQLRRRRRRKTESGQETFEKAELHGEAVEQKQPGTRAKELGVDAQVHEMGTPDKPVEIGADEPRELPADFEGHEVRGDTRKSYIDTSDAKS